MKLTPRTPIAALLNGSLLLAPLVYLFLDITYGMRGWQDASTGALHVLAAAVYGLAALRLVTLTEGIGQAILAVVAVLGTAGNVAVGVNTMSVGLGGIDLFDAGGPADVFKSLGFFFPLTFLLTALLLRHTLPWWGTALLTVGAITFPAAHVGNITWLAIVDAIVMAAALGTVFAVVRDSDRSAGRSRDIHRLAT